MRAIVIREPGDETVLRMGEAPSPALGPADLRIRVRTTAVNRADLLQRQGLYPPPPGASPILGMECAGEVVEVGPEARGFTPGQRVMAAIDYRREDFSARARELTSGRGVDVVLDHIGAAYLANNLAALAVGGRLVVIGLMGGAQAEVNLAQLLIRRLALIGSTLRARSIGEKARIVEGFRARFGAALAAGRLRPPIARVLPLAEAAEAHRLMQSSAHFGKIVLRVG